MKSIVFAGSSITWGEGLHYYSDLPHLNLSAEAFDRNDFNKISTTISKNEYILDTNDILLYN